MVWVTIQVGKGYVPELDKRMRQYKIGKGELCRAMEPPFDRTLLSRYFSKSPTRKLSPTMETVERIERAMAKLIRVRDSMPARRRVQPSTGGGDAMGQ